jgi:hypothetical protein
MALLIGGRGVLRGLAFAGVAAAGYAFGVTSDNASAQPAPAVQPPQPQPKAQPQPQPPLPQPDRSVVAYITNPSNKTLIPITREEFGEYLIARGGAEKLELFVNKRIIEIEAARRGVTVTTVEIKAKLEDVLRGLGINLRDFEKHVLPRYKKTLYEYVEDVLKPELLLTKMCQDRVKITEDDLKKAYENKYGERRQAKVICWNKTDERLALKQWDEARQSDEAFDRIARTQGEGALASSGGLVAPIGRHSEAKDDKIERVLWSLKVGEMSQLFETQQGIICVKLHAIIPPDPNVPFDEKMKAALRNELFAKRIDNELGKFFQEIKSAAQAQLYYKGPPSAEEYREGVNQIINHSNLTPTGGAPPAPAVPMAPMVPGAVRPGRP